jgi:hypothetical protein
MCELVENRFFLSGGEHFELSLFYIFFSYAIYNRAEKFTTTKVYGSLSTTLFRFLKHTASYWMSVSCFKSQLIFSFEIFLFYWSDLH